MGFRYIIIIECPIEREPKYIISSDRISYVPNHIRTQQAYQVWKNKLEQLDLKVGFTIIDKVVGDKSEYWINFYVELFKTWGIILWNSLSKEDKMNEFNKQHINNILMPAKGYEPADIMPFRKREKKNLNLNTIVYFLNDLLSVRYDSKLSDNFTLAYILVFFYGYDLTDLINMTFSRLAEQLDGKSKNINIKHCKYYRLEKFIRKYIVKYSGRGKSLDWIESELFKVDDLINGKDFTSKLEGLMEFMGYKCTFGYGQHEKLFCLLTIHLSENKEESVNFISKNYNYSPEYLKLMTLNAVYCNIQVPGNLEHSKSLLRTI